VQNLLNQESNLNFLGCENDIKNAIVRVEYLQPDVIIVEKDLLETDQGHPLRCMLRSRIQLNIIELDPEDETISIYSCHQKIIKQVQDLIEVIEATGYI
jgi:hypothetical protein